MSEAYHSHSVHHIPSTSSHVISVLVSPQVRVAGLLKQSGVEPEHIAILTPYNAQVSKIKKILKKRHLANVSVCTIMKSQGVLF